MHLPIYYEYGSRVNIIAGFEALEKIPGLLQRWAARRPMLIAGNDISAAGLTDLVARSLLPGISVGAVLDDVEANADAALINRMVQVFRESACDAILAVGGGSVLDSAKVVNIALAHGADDWPRCAGADSLKHPLKPLIAIPTTAGSGSEVSPVGWAAARCDLIQRALACSMLLPHAAVLDPRMTLSLCSEITAASAMEALSHAMEAYTCLGKNPISDAHAFSAIRLISENLFHVLQAPSDPKGRLALAVGACLAGLALANSTAGMAHALGNAMGSLCRAPRGKCLAILLPYSLEYNMSKNGRLIAELLLPLAGAHAFAETPKHLRAERVVTVIREFNQRLHDLTGGQHPRCLNEIKELSGRLLIPETSLAKIAQSTRNTVAIFGNPQEMDANDALRVLHRAWEGFPLNSAHPSAGGSSPGFSANDDK